METVSAHAYTEDQLVEQPAIGLFAELGWAVAGPPSNAGVDELARRLSALHPLSGAVNLKTY